MTDSNIDVEAIPETLTERAQWVGWKAVERDGKQTKIPVSPATGSFASSTDSETWGTFEAARTMLQEGTADGVGFVFSEDDPFVGIDLDDCRDSQTGAVEEWAEDIIERLDSYTEISPSGTGYHVLIEGDLPEGRNRHRSVELYETARFFTVTGEQVEAAPKRIARRQDALEAIHREYVQPESDSSPGNDEQASVIRTPTVSLDEDDLLQKARRASNGEKFERLWNGNTGGYESHSEADMALCCLLAFWTGRDGRRVDRLFRESGLLRGKWDEVHYADGATYGERTVERALQVTTDAYDPEHSSDSEKASDAERGDTTQPSDRSHAYLVERNRLLRERIDRLVTDLEDADERIESLRGTVKHLEANLTEREWTIDTLREDAQSRESRGAWGRAKRAFERDTSE